jgi:hypothetical protein
MFEGPPTYAIFQKYGAPLHRANIYAILLVVRKVATLQFGVSARKAFCTSNIPYSRKGFKHFWKLKYTSRHKFGLFI